jgi:hypothetical protein
LFNNKTHTRAHTWRADRNIATPCKQRLGGRRQQSNDIAVTSSVGNGTPPTNKPTATPLTYRPTTRNKSAICTAVSFFGAITITFTVSDEGLSKVNSLQRDILPVKEILR